nr:MAG: hypothetical protein ADFBMEEK_00013 [Peromyscus leucopus gammaherpesvirus]
MARHWLREVQSASVVLFMCSPLIYSIVYRIFGTVVIVIYSIITGPNNRYRIYGTEL